MEYHADQRSGNNAVHSHIGIGLTISNYPDNQQPGWAKGSWAYHGDDGNRFWFIITEHDLFHHDAYGPQYTEGDVIGCGVNNATNEMFFTKNGEVRRSERLRTTTDRRR